MVIKEKVETVAKQVLSKYGLKAGSLSRVVNIIENRISSMGTIEEDKIDEVINKQIAELTPYMDVFQSEIDSVRASVRSASTPNPTPSPAPAPAPAPETNGKLSELEERLAKQDEIIQSLKSSLETKAQQEQRANVIQSLKTAMFPEGQFDANAFDAVCYELGDKLVGEVKVEDLSKEALDKYNNRISTSPFAFTPRISTSGGKTGEEGKKATSDLIDNIVKNSRV